MKRWLGCWRAASSRSLLREVYQKVADSYRARPDPELSSIKGVLDSLPEEKARRTAPESLIDNGRWGDCQERRD